MENSIMFIDIAFDRKEAGDDFPICGWEQVYFVDESDLSYYKMFNRDNQLAIFDEAIFDSYYDDDIDSIRDGLISNCKTEAQRKCVDYWVNEYKKENFW